MYFGISLIFIYYRTHVIVGVINLYIILNYINDKRSRLNYPNIYLKMQTYIYDMNAIIYCTNGYLL